MDDSGVTTTRTDADRQPLPDRRSAGGARSARVRPATLREDVVAALLSACLVAGILSDAWAHVHRGRTLEGFFTPWHGLLYAGFVGAAGWTFWLAYQRRDEARRWWRDGFPAGYRLGAIGALGFLAGGLGDMVWHERFGVELGVNAAFSPSHLLVATAGTLLVTSPLRSWWQAPHGPGHPGGGLRAAVGVGSLGLAVMIATPLLNHSIALATAGPTVAYDPAVLRGPERVVAIAAVDAYLITTVILVLPLLLVHRRRTAPGTGTALVGGVATFVLVMFGFPEPQTTAALAALAAAAVVDATLARLDAVRGRDAALRLPLAGALFGAAVTAGHLLGLQIADAVRWSPEMWTGTIALTGVVGALLGTLAARPAADLP